MARERLVTRRLNNMLAIGLGVPIGALGIAGLSSPVVSEFRDFVAMAVLGAVY